MNENGHPRCCQCDKCELDETIKPKLKEICDLLEIPLRVFQKSLSFDKLVELERKLKTSEYRLKIEKIIMDEFIKIYRELEIKENQNGSN